MVEAPRECTGACDDRRAVLVRAALHEHVVAAREADRRRAVSLAALAERLAAGSWDAREARAALREAGSPGAGIEEEDSVAGWFCFGCGRFEAPQACLGVCIHRPSELVRRDVHERVVAEAAAARARAERLAALARRAAWTSPRAGRREESARALAAAARELLF